MVLYGSISASFMKAFSLILTLVFEFLFVGASYYEYVRSSRDDYSIRLGDIAVLGGASLLILLLWNAVLCFRRSKDRALYGLSCAIIIITGSSFVMFYGAVDARRDKWFLEKGINGYEHYVRVVEANKHLLSQRGKGIGSMFGPAPYGKDEIDARTNADGSLVVVFYGRNNYRPATYVYYSGDSVEPVAGESNFYYLEHSRSEVRKLTNKWYQE